MRLPGGALPVHHGDGLGPAGAGPRAGSRHPRAPDRRRHPPRRRRVGARACLRPARPATATWRSDASARGPGPRCPAATRTPVPRGAASSSGASRTSVTRRIRRRVAGSRMPGAATTTSPLTAPESVIARPSSTPVTRTPVRRSTPKRSRSDTSASTSRNTPPRMPATCDPAARSRAESADGAGQRPLVQVRGAKTRRGLVEGEFVGRGRVHAAHHRRDESVEHRSPHPAPHQFAERLVARPQRSRSQRRRARARSAPRIPIAAMTSFASGTAGIPRMLVAGMATAEPSAR